MFRLYSHFWRACCFLLPSCIIHVQKAMNVSAKITRVAGLAPWSSFDGVRPSNYCVLVSKRHVFYVLFEPLLGFREHARKPMYFTLFFEWKTTLFALFHLTFYTNGSSKIASLAGPPLHAPIWLSSPSNFDECSG